MTKEQHLIIPPPGLVDSWLNQPDYTIKGVIYKASQWGADEELEMTLAEVFFLGGSALADRVRAARRPKPPSLKEQALALLEPGETRLLNREQQDIIRRALEKLPDE